jgi:Na+-transporting NADH:ubiquinone oxidoreductase subunit B
MEPFKGWPGGFAEWAKPMDAMTAATPLINFKNGEMTEIADLFYGSIGGSLGETSAVLILVFGTILLITRVANWRLTLSTLAGAMALAWAMHTANPEQFASPLFHLLSGGLLFGAFYMVTDPVSAPLTSPAKYVYGILIGVLTIIIRNLSGFPEGMMFAILMMNMFAPVLDDAVLSIRFKRIGEGSI